MAENYDPHFSPGVPGENHTPRPDQRPEAVVEITAPIFSLNASVIFASPVIFLELKNGLELPDNA
jgi:hypothetical protein